MKRFSFLPMVTALVLAVVAFSCSPMNGGQDEYYERRTAGNRVYVDDPYRGTVVLERDPYSGRYYEVGAYGQPYGRTYNNRVYNSRAYGRSNGRGGYYRNNNNGSYRGNTPQRPAQEPNRDDQRKRDDARRKVLGN